MSTIIRVEHLSKQYRIGTSARHNSFRDIFDEKLAHLFKKLDEQETSEINSIWALHDVSFDVQQGDVVGIIGRNGSGKSTLLKILSRITEPTIGKIHLKGRVASLLEVGTGFSSELTGRENVFLNGSIMGMKKSEIKSKFDELVAFAEVDKFIDTPVKRYSSGMYMRLAFAVAAHLQSEILIVDEVLAVGDMQFQRKCLQKMDEAGKQGRTVLFVSHNMALVNSICTNGFLLDKGRMVFSGSAQNTIDTYIKAQKVETVKKIEQIAIREGNQFGRFVDITVLKDGEQITSMEIGDSFEIELEIHLDHKMKEPHIGILFGNGYLDQIARAHTWESCADIPMLNEGKHIVRCSIQKFPLLQGHYYVHLWLGEKSECWDYIRNAASVTIESTDIFKTGRAPKENTCLCYFEHDWEID